MHDGVDYSATSLTADSVASTVLLASRPKPRMVLAQDATNKALMRTATGTSLLSFMDDISRIT